MQGAFIANAEDDAEEDDADDNKTVAGDENDPEELMDTYHAGFKAKNNRQCCVDFFPIIVLDPSAQRYRRRGRHDQS